MILSLIAAASENNVIGRDGELPWNLPDDLQHFKEITSGSPVIMGRKTFESIGRALPNRRNIVITRGNTYEAENCEIAHSIDDALSIISDEEEVFVIGGGEIYRQALLQADRIYLTRVHDVVDGDAFFPEMDEDEWEEVSREEHTKDEKNNHDYTFLVYERV